MKDPRLLSLPRSIWAGPAPMLAHALGLGDGRRDMFSQADGDTTPSNSGGLTSSAVSGTNSAVVNSAGVWINGTSSASAGELAGRQSNTLVYGQFKPITDIAFESGSSFADVRWWNGVTDGAFADTDDPTSICVLFRASSTTDETWKLLTNDGGVNPPTVVDTGLPMAVSARYDFRVVIPGDGNAYGLIATAGAGLCGPYAIQLASSFSLSTALTMFAGCEAKAASAKSARWSRFAVNQV